MLRLSRGQSNIIGKFFSSGVLEELCRNVQYTAGELNLIDIKHIFTRLTQQKSSILSSCIIIANIKFTFWQVSILENSFSGKCPFGQMYIHSCKCPFRKIAFLGNVHSAKCTFWQVSILENSFSGKCPFG